MKAWTFLLVSFSVAASGAAPVVQRWAAHLDVSQYDQMVGMGLDAHGNIYVAGNTAGSNGLGAPDVPLGLVVAKYTPAGANVWTLLSPAEDSVVARGFRVDESGQCYVTGSIFGEGTEQLFTAKYSAGGERVWERRHPLPDDGSLSSGRSVITDAHGNVWAAGAVVANGGGTTYQVAGLLIEYDAQGNPLKEVVEVLPGVAYTAGFSSLALDPMGNLLLRIPGYPTNAGWQAYVVKYSAAGERLWTRATDVIDLSAFGKYPLAGPLADAQGNLFLTGPVLETDFHIKVMKFNSAGEPLWNARYSPRRGGGSDVSDLAVDADGSVVVTGNSDTAYIYDDFYVRDIVTLKYDADGKIRWLARGTKPVTPINGRKVALDGRGNTYVAGEIGRTSLPEAPLYQVSRTMKFNRLGQREWIVGKEDGPGPGQVAGLALTEKHAVVLGGSDELNFGSPMDLHLVNYVEKASLAAPQFLGRVRVYKSGPNLVLDVKAIGRGKLFYQWFRDGLPVSQDPDKDSRRLTIPNVPASAGEYYVEVSNIYGDAVSETVRIGLPSLDAVPVVQAE